MDRKTKLPRPAALAWQIESILTLGGAAHHLFVLTSAIVWPGVRRGHQGLMVGSLSNSIQVIDGRFGGNYLGDLARCPPALHAQM